MRVLCRVAGQWVDDWPATDRGLQYGDGLFETMRLARGDVPLWQFHAERLQQGLKALLFPADSFHVIADAMGELADIVPLEQYSAAKLLVSRGSGQRGYALPDHPDINLQVQLMQAPGWLHERYPQGICTGINPVRLSQQPLLAGIKHLNRLEQVLARAEFACDWQESVMLDQQGWVVEGCYSNLYASIDGQWVTPVLQQCGVNGVIRRWLLSHGFVAEMPLSCDELFAADAVALSNSLNGIAAVRSIDAIDFNMRHPALDGLKRMQQTLETLF